MKKPKIDLSDDFFGAVLNCAVRYSLGRQSYMPGLVMDFITPLLPYLSDKTLWCFEKDVREYIAPTVAPPACPIPTDIFEAWKTFYNKVQAAMTDKAESPCKGCLWKAEGRHQRCTCCCRNEHLKDNYTQNKGGLHNDS